MTPAGRCLILLAVTCLTVPVGLVLGWLLEAAAWELFKLWCRCYHDRT